MNEPKPEPVPDCTPGPIQITAPTSEDERMHRRIDGLTHSLLMQADRVARMQTEIEKLRADLLLALLAKPTKPKAVKRTHKPTLRARGKR
ncbi:MAG: hypothetical protein V4636_12970 [Pseudomonadota bacterium]